MLELALMLDLLEEQINIWNVRNSVNSCCVHKYLLSIKYRKKTVDNITHKNTLKLLSSPLAPLVHFTFKELS